MPDLSLRELFKESLDRLIGGEDVRIDGPAPLDRAGPRHISFCRFDGNDAVTAINKSSAGVVIINRGIDIEKLDLSTKGVFLDPQPRLAFLRIVKSHFNPTRPTGIHPTAFIHNEASIGKNVYVGPFTYVGKSSIGDGTVIFGHCHIYDDVKIGNNVTIHAGTILGADGFGYERNELGELEKFPHLGGILIEDDVEIGANTCIDRGTLADTTVKRRAKIDNLVHVAHNTIIGEDAAVIALTMIGGSTKIGAQAWIAPASVLRDQLIIGSGATVGLGSVVTKDVPDKGTVMGNPAREIEESKRINAALKRLVQE